jgi:hypothetical protein
MILWLSIKQEEWYMGTNNIFSLSRFNVVFRNLLKEKWKENLRFYTFSFAVLLIFDIIICYSEYNDNMIAGHIHTDSVANGMEGTYFILFLFGCGCGYTLHATNDMRRKGERIFALTTPATTFEKWVSRWIVYTFFFFMVSPIIFFAVDALRVEIFRYIFPHQYICFIGFAGYKNIMIMHPWPKLFIVYFFMQSLFMFFACFYPKSPKKLVLISLAVIFATFFALKLFLIHYINVGLKMTSNVFLYILFVLIIVNWALSYISFKKMEIIDRW